MFLHVEMHQDIRNSMKEDRANALGMLSAEKVFLNIIENFN